MGTVSELHTVTTAGYVPVDHPGVVVPEVLRPWKVAWPGYAPMDVTPPELRPEALAAGAPEWAEGAASPDAVADWSTRQAEAVVPFGRDEHGWPLHPCGRTGRTGRNLGRWGENAAADPIVIAGTGADRRVLLIQRDDIGVWAIPGGMVDPGEAAPTTLVRELYEEAGVDLSAVEPAVVSRTVVADWRQSDHAWVASTSALFQLPGACAIRAGDDAADAAWFPFPALAGLAEAVEADGGQLYDAHRPLLAAALHHLDQQ